MSEKLSRLIWERLVEVIERVKGKKKVEILMDGLLTETERKMMAKRIMAYILLKSEWEVVEVSRTLKMSNPTVYKLKALMDRNEDFKSLLESTFPGRVEYKASYQEENMLEKLLLIPWRVKYGRLGRKS